MRESLETLRAALGDRYRIEPERFLREICITAGLTHAHILPLHDSREVGALLYYVMPYVEGETLRARLNRERQLPIDEPVAVALDVASALIGHVGPSPVGYPRQTRKSLLTTFR